MKRLELIRHLQDHGCALLREGGRHSVFVNRLRDPAEVEDVTQEAFIKARSGSLRPSPGTARSTSFWRARSVVTSKFPSRELPHHHRSRAI
jgi:hypothetical protein